MPIRLINHTLFQGWDVADLKALLATSSLESYQAKEILFRRGEHSTGFYIINEGQVELQLISPKGMIKKLHTLQAGELLGEACMLMAQPYRVDAVALGAVQLTQISQQAYFTFLTKNPNLMRSLLATLSERLYYLLGDLLTVRLHSGTQRVICYLLSGSSLRDGTRITLAYPKSKIAADLNLTPEHFSRILNNLSSRGFILVEGRYIEFLDLEGLFAYER